MNVRAFKGRLAEPISLEVDIVSDIAAVQQRIAEITGVPAQPPAAAVSFGAHVSGLMTSPSAPAPAPLSMPVSGAITSDFGERANPMGPGTEFHPGVDIAAEQGTPIAAAMAGRVVSVGREGGYGNLITVDDGNGVTTRYGHCSEIFARVGQLVAPGEVIGAVGMTGRATGPHLHFEMRQNDQPIDPRPYLPL